MNCPNCAVLADEFRHAIQVTQELFNKAAVELKDECQTCCQKLEADCAEMREALERVAKYAGHVTRCEPNLNCRGGCDQARYAEQVLDKLGDDSNAGQSLLKELQALRKVAEASKDFLNHPALYADVGFRNTGLRDRFLAFSETLTELDGVRDVTNSAPKENKSGGDVTT